MAMQWFFWMEGRTVRARARAEDDSGRIGDAFTSVHPGGNLYGVSYDKLAKCGAGGGVLEVDADGRAVIAQPERHRP